MAQTTSFQERRRDRRFRHGIRVLISTGRTELTALTEDVSFTGIFVRMDVPIPVRQLVRLKLTLPPGDEQVSVMGMVARHTPASAGRPPGVGIQFYALGAFERRRIVEFVRFVATRASAATAPRAEAEAVPLAPATPPPASPSPVPAPSGLLSAEPVRRRHPRHAVALQVKLHSVGDLERLYTRNISKGGLFVATRLEVPIGMALRVSVVHPRSGDQFALEAVVRRRSASGEPGLGLEFTGMTNARGDEFLEFIRSEVPVEQVFYIPDGDTLLATASPEDVAELVALSDADIESVGA